MKMIVTSAHLSSEMFLPPSFTGTRGSLIHLWLRSSCKHTYKTLLLLSCIEWSTTPSPGAPPKYYYVCLRATRSLTLSPPQSEDPRAASVKLLASQKDASEHKPIFINIIFVYLQEGHTFDVFTQIWCLKSTWNQNSESFIGCFLSCFMHDSSVQVIG